MVEYFRYRIGITVMSLFLGKCLLFKIIVPVQTKWQSRHCDRWCWAIRPAASDNFVDFVCVEVKLMLLCGVVDFFPDMAPVEHIGWSVLIGTEPDKILVLVNDPDVVMFPELEEY